MSRGLEYAALTVVALVAAFLIVAPVAHAVSVSLNHSAALIASAGAHQ